MLPNCIMEAKRAGSVIEALEWKSAAGLTVEEEPIGECCCWDDGDGCPDDKGGLQPLMGDDEVTVVGVVGAEVGPEV
jgi:hypothetical protein